MISEQQSQLSVDESMRAGSCSVQNSIKLQNSSELVRVANDNKDSHFLNMIQHLGQLADGIFALAMVVAVLGFQLPESADFTNKADIKNFLLAQIEPLIGYVTAFLVLAIYWIEHRQKFIYYRKTDTVHLWMYLLYLMCLIVIPYSNILVTYYLENSMSQIWFSLNIFLKGVFSFSIWKYATDKHRLVEPNLDAKTININKRMALIEPIFSLVTIVISLTNSSLWLMAWLLIPIPYILIERFSKEPTTKVVVMKGSR